MRGTPGRTRLRRGALAALVALGALTVPARAGTEEDPEIVSECGNPGVVPMHDSLDVCSAWFRGLWRLESTEPTGEQNWILDGLETTLRVERMMNDRPPYARHAIGWEVGGCDMVWLLHRALDAGSWQVTFSHCLADGSFQDHVVPEDQISIKEDRITVELGLSTELAMVASHFSLGSRLEDLYAATLLGVETDTHPFEVTYSIDYAEGTRPFLIGQDQPQD